MVSKQELEERVECGHCGGIQALFSGVRCASQLEDTCTCPVEPPEMTEMKREQAHMAAALAAKEKNVSEELGNWRGVSNKAITLLRTLLDNEDWGGLEVFRDEAQAALTELEADAYTAGLS